MILLAMKTLTVNFAFNLSFVTLKQSIINYIVRKIVGYPVILSFCLSPSMSRLCGAGIVDCDSVVFVISYSKLAF